MLTGLHGGQRKPRKRTASASNIKEYLALNQMILPVRGHLLVKPVNVAWISDGLQYLESESAAENAIVPATLF
jgi:hypothetical protein